MPSGSIRRYLGARAVSLASRSTNAFCETPEGVSFQLGQQQEALLVAYSDAIGTFMRERLSAIASSMNEPAVLI